MRSRSGAGAGVAGGKDPAFTNRIDLVTIASLGDAIDFGDLTRSEIFMSGTSNNIRGIFAGGVNDTPSSDTRKDTIDYITIASTGNASDFGNLLAAIESPTAFSDSHGSHVNSFVLRCEFSFSGDL